MPRPDALEFMQYSRNGVDRIACRIERGGLAFVAETPRKALFVDLSRFTRLAALVAVLLLAMGMLASFLISRRLTGSISSLVGAARRIAEKDYRFELDINTGDEMEFLYSAFKDMGGEISRFTTDLEVLVAARTGGKAAISSRGRPRAHRATATPSPSSSSTSTTSSRLTTAMATGWAMPSSRGSRARPKGS